MRVKFFIINPPLCKHEGDEMAKILYYHPKDESDLKKLQAIGLGEALIQVSKRFAGTCEALTTAKFIHGFLEPESDILISLIIENPDSNISHALLSAVISDWYELYSRLNGPIGASGIAQLTAFFDTAVANMPIYSYSLPELFRSFNFAPDSSWQMDYLYLISRCDDRFARVRGHLFFNQNQVFMTNIDRQTVYILMLYLNHYISERDNGFLKLPYDTINFGGEKRRLLVYYRQDQMLVMLFDSNTPVDTSKMKVFLDKNLILKDLASTTTKAGGNGAGKRDEKKDDINYFLCNDTNGISNENIFQYKYLNGVKQPKLHPDVNSLVIELQQTYLIPNGGETSAQTSDKTWILTKCQNNRTAVFVHKNAKDKNLAEVTNDVNALCEKELMSLLKFELP